MRITDSPAFLHVNPPARRGGNASGRTLFPPGTVPGLARQEHGDQIVPDRAENQQMTRIETVEEVFESPPAFSVVEETEDK